MSVSSSSVPTCMVLSGATVPFDELIEVIDRSLVKTLHELGYGALTVQYGHAGNKFDLPKEFSSVKINGFDFDPNVRDLVQNADLVITHAGAGSIFDAVERGEGETDRKIVVVNNMKLMNNHQLELAQKLDKMGCVIYTESPKFLISSVKKAMDMKFKKLPPPDSIKPLLYDLINK